MRSCVPGCLRTSADFPWTLVLTSGLFRMLAAMSGALIFPFMPTMLHDMGVPPGQVGSWAGSMASAFFLAQLPSSIFWGWLSDRIGRRPIVAISLLGQACSLLTIGLSTIPETCLAARLFGGALSGAEPAIVAAIRERTPKQHRTRAFTYSQAGFSGGVLAGPMIGGMLAKPADTIHSLRGTVFDRKPYLLTCGVASALQLFGLCFVHLLPRKRKALSTQDGASDSIEMSSPAAAEATEPPPKPTSRFVSWLGSRGRGFRRGVRAICTNTVITLCLTCIFMMHAVQSAMGELFPLFASSNSSSAHGLGLEPIEIGESLMPLGFMLFVVSVSINHLERCFGLKPLFYFGMTLFGIIIVSVSTVLPALKAVSDTLLWCGLITMGLLRPCAGMLSMSAMGIMYNNALTADFGLYNGLAQSVTSFGRCISPVSAGTLFDIGISNEGAFPLGVHLPFVVAGSLAFLAVAISCCLPKHVGRRPNKPTGNGAASGTVNDTKSCTTMLPPASLAPEEASAATKTRSPT